MAKVLIVDDEASVRDTLGMLIEAGGHTVWKAEGGYEATSRFDVKQVDLAVVDLIMPDQGGLETIAELRKLNPRLKVIAVSGAPAAGRRRLLDWAERMGADRTFGKPFAMGELLGSVGRTLERRESQTTTA